MRSQAVRTAVCFCIFLTFSCCHFACADAPAIPAFSEQWRNILGVDSLAASGIAVADVNADGNPDFVFTGTRNANTLLFVLAERPDGNIGIVQALTLPDAANIVRVLSATVGGAAHIYTIASGGAVRDYSGWPLAEQNNFAVATSPVFAAIGDLTGGGSNSLLVLTSSSLYAYAASDGSPQWSYAVSGATEVALAQLDADAASEIILNTTPGLVMDGMTQTTDSAVILPRDTHLGTAPRSLSARHRGLLTPYFAAIPGHRFGARATRAVESLHWRSPISTTTITTSFSKATRNGARSTPTTPVRSNCAFRSTTPAGASMQLPLRM